MSQNGQTHFKNLAAFTARFLKSDNFGTLCMKGLRLLLMFLERRSFGTCYAWGQITYLGETLWGTRGLETVTPCDTF